MTKILLFIDILNSIIRNYFELDCIQHTNNGFESLTRVDLER